MSFKNAIVLGAAVAPLLVAAASNHNNSDLFKRVHDRVESSRTVKRQNGATLSGDSSSSNGVQFARFEFEMDGDVAPVSGLAEITTGAVTSEQACVDTCASFESCVLARIVNEEDASLYCYTYSRDVGGNSFDLAAQNFMALNWKFNVGADSGNTCASTIDSFVASGECVCASGRTNINDYTCTNTGTTSKTVTTYALAGPVTIDYSISWSDPFMNDPAVLTVTECAALCTSDDTCKLFYYSPAGTAADAEAECWKIGYGDSYSNDDFASRPRAYTGQIGADGGIVGVITATTGCDATFGDVVQADFSCECGPGRVNTDPLTCAFPAASAAVRRLAKQKRAFNGVQW